LQKLVGEFKLENYVQFAGPVPYTEVVGHYQKCDIHVNMMLPGSLDKAVLEAMACEKPVVVSNEAFRELLKPYDDFCLFRHKDSSDLAEKLKAILDKNNLWSEIGTHNRQQIVKHHSISHLADSLVAIFEQVPVKRPKK